MPPFNVGYFFKGGRVGSFGGRLGTGGVGGRLEFVEGVGGRVEVDAVEVIGRGGKDIAELDTGIRGGGGGGRGEEGVEG